ncbi:unnamed protein product [Prunus brigantina]
MMKSLYIIILCFLIAVLYFSSHNISSSSLAFLPGRKPMRKLSMPLTNNKHVYQKLKVIDGKSETSMVEEIPVATKYANSNSDLDELIYHIDYHGVTTHPTPRHPKP